MSKYRTNPLFLIFFSILTAFSVLKAAEGDLTPEQETKARAAWVKGYEYFEAAQKAETKRQYQRAADLFADAGSIYRQVRSIWPNWNPFILDYRIKYCEKQRRILEAKARQQNPASASSASSDTVKKLVDQINGLREANSDLEERISRMSGALEKARTEAARGVESVALAEKLVWENKDQKHRLETLMTQISSLKDEVKQLEVGRGLQDKYAQLQEQLVTASKKLDQANQSSQALTEKYQVAMEENKRLSLEKTQAMMKLQEGKDASDALNRQQTIMQQQITALNQEKGELQKDLALSRKQAEEHFSSLEKLRADMEKLRALGTQTATQKALLETKDREITSLRQEVTQLTTNDTATKQELKKVQTELDRMQLTNLQLRNDLKALEHIRPGNGQPSYTELLTKLRATEDKLANQEEQTQAQIELNRALKAHQEALQKKLNSAGQTNPESHAKAINVYELKIAQLESEIKALKTTAAAVVSSEQAANEELVSKTLLLKSEEALKTASRERERLEQELAALKAKPIAVTSDNPAIPETTSTELQNAKTTIENLKRRQSADAHALRTMKSKLSTTEAEVELVKSKLAQAEAARGDEVTRLKALHKAQEELLADKDKRLKTITTNRDELKGKLASLLENIEQLRKEHTAKLTTMESQLNRTVTEVSGLRDANELLKIRLENGGLLPEDVALKNEQAVTTERRLRLAQDAEKEGSLETAVGLYKQILEVHPDNHRALKRLGNILVDKKDFEGGEGYLMKAFYSNPDDIEVLQPLGYLLIRDERPDMGISMLTRAVAMQPDSPECHMYLGVGFLSLGWTQAARAQLQRSWELGELADTAFNLAVSYAATEPQDLEKARLWYGKAIELGSLPDEGLSTLLNAPENE